MVSESMTTTATSSFEKTRNSPKDVRLIAFFPRQALLTILSDAISRLLGQGTFGKVVEAYDRRRRTKCAIKVIRSVEKYREASRIELRVLSTLAQNDAENRNKCIHLRDCFEYRKHTCIVTDLLGQSVFDFLKGNGFVPFPSSQIQSFAKQLLTSVACTPLPRHLPAFTKFADLCLVLHDINLIHTDLKPENILLVSAAYQTFTYNRTIPCATINGARTARQRRVLLDTAIRLIDFGSATFNDEYHSKVVSTRHYRAPEIILNLPWSFSCDMWSVGCILVEFFTGDALFQTHDNLEHLAMMEAVVGSRIDARLVKIVQANARGSSDSAQAARFFKNSRLDYPNKETVKASRLFVKAMKKLQVCLLFPPVHAPPKVAQRTNHACPDRTSSRLRPSSTSSFLTSYAASSSMILISASQPRRHFATLGLRRP